MNRAKILLWLGLFVGIPGAGLLGAILCITLHYYIMEHEWPIYAALVGLLLALSAVSATWVVRLKYPKNNG